jgi:hypothetical protein
MALTVRISTLAPTASLYHFIAVFFSHLPAGMDRTPVRQTKGWHVCVRFFA